MQKCIAITGATSMLGLSLIDEAVDNQTEVIAIIRKNSKRKRLLPENPLISVIECNLDEMSLKEILPNKSCDTFYHFSWEGTENAKRDHVINHVNNIMYTIDALNLAKRMGAKRFIGAGSQAEYGLVQHQINVNTNAAPVTAYGVSKYSSGRLCSILADQIGIEFIWTRIFSTYGIYDSASTMLTYVIDELLNRRKPILTQCEQMWDYLNCRDAARAFYLLGLYGRNQGIYNIGSGIARPLLEYVTIIRNLIDKQLPLGIGEKEYAPKQIMYLCADISNLTADTGFQPRISFERGARETIQWRQQIHREKEA